MMNDEAEHQVRLAHDEIDRVEGEADQHAGCTGECTGEKIGLRIDPVGIDAHQHRRMLVVRYGPDPSTKGRAVM